MMPARSADSDTSSVEASLSKYLSRRPAHRNNRRRDRCDSNRFRESSLVYRRSILRASRISRHFRDHVRSRPSAWERTNCWVIVLAPCVRRQDFMSLTAAPAMRTTSTPTCDRKCLSSAARTAGTIVGASSSRGRSVRSSSWSEKHPARCDRRAGSPAARSRAEIVPPLNPSDGRSDRPPHTR